MVTEGTFCVNTFVVDGGAKETQVNTTETVR